MDASSDALLVAIHGRNAFVKVLRRGSFKICPALKKFGIAALEKGCAEFVIDMDECMGMDSTFMGVLAGLAMRLRRISGEMIIINLSSRNFSLLETLGLGRILTMCPLGNVSEDLKGKLANIPGISKLDTSAPGRKITAEVMLAAHEDLVEVAPENLPKFRDVLTYLKEDLKSASDPDEAGK